MTSTGGRVGAPHAHKTRVAVVGADPSGRGFGARAHIPAILASPGLELAAVCTAREETAAAAAARWGVPRSFSDYAQLMAAPDIDLVTVAVRVRLHRPIVEAALEAGKMVYCEWPLCLTVDEAVGLAERARGDGVVCGVGIQGRFSSGVQAAKRLLDDGAIGRPLSFQVSQLLSPFPVDSDRWWLAEDEEASGALHVATGHILDVAKYLLGEVSAVTGLTATAAASGRFRDTNEEFTWTAADTVAFLVTLEGGVFGAGHVTNTAYPSTGFALRVLGEEGQVLVRAPGYVQFAPTTAFFGRRGERALHEVPPPRQLDGLESLGDEDPALNVARALSQLVSARDTASKFHPDFDDAAKLHGIIEAIARASRRHAWERIRAN